MIKLRSKRPQCLVHHELFSYLITTRFHGIHQFLDLVEIFSNNFVFLHYQELKPFPQEVLPSYVYPHLHMFLPKFPMPLSLFQLRKFCWGPLSSHTGTIRILPCHPVSPRACDSSFPPLLLCYWVLQHHFLSHLLPPESWKQLSFWSSNHQTFNHQTMVNLPYLFLPFRP